MKVTIEVESKNDIKSIQVISTEDSFSAVPVKKGDKRIDPEGLFGIWANNPRSLEDIRKGVSNLRISQKRDRKN